MKYIIGISSFYHDSSVALISDKGETIAAYHEERFSRIRHDNSFPKLSLSFLKNNFNIHFRNVSAVIFYEKPTLKFFRTIESILKNVPYSFDLFSSYISSFGKKDRGFLNQLASQLDNIWPSKEWVKKIKFSSHHYSHASSAFLNSPFNESAILTVDGVGEYDTCTIMYGNDNNIKKLFSLNYPNSIGILYSAFTAFCGMKPNSGEYKLMGLAPYGEPVFANIIKEKIVRIDTINNTIILNNKIINPDLPMTKTLANISKILKINPATEDKLNINYANIASSIQIVLNEILLLLADKAFLLTNSKNLVLSGGVALNCVSNSFISSNGKFKNIWVFPAAGDAGCALGSAQAYLFNKNPKVFKKKIWFNPYLGSSFNRDTIKNQLDSCDAKYEEVNKNENTYLRKIAKILKNKGAGGIFLSRSEYGPRALGARSIIGLASDKTAQLRLNIKTKFRESFRRFAPLVLEKDFSKYFSDFKNCNVNKNYMLFTFNVKNSIKKTVSKINNSDNFEKIVNQERSTLPAITHVDYSARVQVLSKKAPKIIYEFYSRLIKELNEDVLINTSFNVRGEPIVDSPMDAFSAFMRTDLDFLLIDNFLLIKDLQTAKKSAFHESFNRD